jgi:sigma-B regulation protein RsbU (phosphoserine phosphatase)
VNPLRTTQKNFSPPEGVRPLKPYNEDRQDYSLESGFFYPQVHMVKILVIDDDATMRLLVTLVLRKQGYEVIQAKNGEEGLALAHDILPALIICDWMMPKMDGLQVCQAIKSDPKFSATFFILLTAREEVADRIQGLDTGADEFLSKPIESTELQSRVRAGLRLYQLNQTLQKLAADLQRQKQLLEAELAEAAAYVQSLLPLPQQGEVSIRSYFLPSTQLGGDFFYYDWIQTSESRLLRFYFLDVSGHGLRAALLSVSIRNFLHLSSLQEQRINLSNPAAVLTLLNDNFSMEDHNGQYFTIVYGTYNPKTRELCYANAGHPPALLICPGAEQPLTSLAATGIPVGFMPEFEFEMKSQIIPELSKLYTFSDGIYEMIDTETGKPWGLEKFSGVLQQFAQSSSVSLETLIEQVQAETGVKTFDDDCAIIEFNFT